MATYPSKTKVTTAVSSHSKQNLTFVHDTTSNILDFNVALCQELAPSNPKKFKHRIFSRLEPMPVPTLGSLQFHTNVFFVPYRTIFPAFSDLITDAVHTYSDGESHIPSYVPRVLMSTLTGAFISSRGTVNALCELVEDPDAKCDFVQVSSNGTSTKYNFTKRGKVFYRILRACGYQLDFNEKNVHIDMSAGPLLACGKVYYDWYYPTQYIQDDVATAVSSLFVLDYGINDTYLTTIDIQRLADFMYKVSYNSDYFVNAWDNPTGPNSGGASSYQINDITFSGGSGVLSSDENTDNTAVIAGTSQTRGNISLYAINALRSLSDFLKRHQLAGSRAIDRYLARWGIALPADKLNRSYKIASYNQDIIIGDVTSTSDTANANTGEGAVLGSYSGKGISINNNGDTWDIETDEFGYIVVCSNIIPFVGYSQGIDRQVYHTSKLDFYTPEFDNLGVQAISKSELYVPLDGNSVYKDNDSIKAPINYNESLFGFVPRYAEYKVSRDIISGDYVLGSLNAGKDAWTLRRDLTPIVKEVGVAGLIHDQDFVQGLDSEQYDRIFYTTGRQDQFYIQHIFNVESSFPGKSLYDSYEFETDDTNAKTVSLDVNGSKVN